MSNTKSKEIKRITKNAPMDIVIYLEKNNKLDLLGDYLFVNNKKRNDGTYYNLIANRADGAKLRLRNIFCDENTNYVKETINALNPDKDGGNRFRTRVFYNHPFLINIRGEKKKLYFTDQWAGKENDNKSASVQDFVKQVNQIFGFQLTAKRYENEKRIVLSGTPEIPTYTAEEKSIDSAGTTTDSPIEQSKAALIQFPEEFKTPFARRFITSLLAKPFAILTGNSGTGKTRIALRLAKFFETLFDGKPNWALIPVGADWTDNTKMLGYFNPLANEGKGEYVKTETISLLERANSHPNIPFFLILDEMNLSQVERYFSDFLSRMETPDLPFVLDNYPGHLTFPKNLFVVGTVNIDETTYMFSPKVLDRANVIEFVPSKEDVMEILNGENRFENDEKADLGMAEKFLLLSENIRSGKIRASKYTLQKASSIFGEAYDLLNEYGFAFAYRSMNEICHYLAAHESLSIKDVKSAIDEELLQKIMPKIHGNDGEIGEMLKKFDVFCGVKQTNLPDDLKNIPQENMPLSLKKIREMRKKLYATHYASYL